VTDTLQVSMRSMCAVSNMHMEQIEIVPNITSIYSTTAEAKVNYWIIKRGFFFLLMYCSIDRNVPLNTTVAC
jgi:hypothetical protein